MSQDSGGPQESQYAQNLEQWKAKVQADLEVWKHNRTQSLQWDQGAFDFAVLALRSVILINGGAAVALLAFLAHLWTTEGRHAAIIAPVFESLSEFVIGIAAGVAACGVGYLSTYFNSGALQMNPDRYKRLRLAFLWIGGLGHMAAVILVVYSFLRFWWGVSSAGQALTGTQ